MGRAILAAQSIRTHDMTLWAKLGYLNPHNYGPAMIAPLVDAQGSRGAVLMVRTRERTPFTPAEVELASMFAAQVAVALELNEMRAEAEQVRVLSDRNQIACDLHDNVIQRLFAIGVGLQALLEQPLPASTAARLSRHVAELDETIEQIRTRIFGLQVEPELPARPRFPRLPATSVRAGTGSPSDVLS
jgi:signal transduction histidine kinase